MQDGAYLYFDNTETNRNVQPRIYRNGCCIGGGILGLIPAFIGKNLDRQRAVNRFKDEPRQQKRIGLNQLFICA